MFCSNKQTLCFAAGINKSLALCVNSLSSILDLSGAPPGTGAEKEISSHLRDFVLAVSSSGKNVHKVHALISFRALLKCKEVLVKTSLASI